MSVTVGSASSSTNNNLHLWHHPSRSQPEVMFQDVYELCRSSALSAQSNGGDAPTTDELLACMSSHLSGDRGAREFSRVVLVVYSAALVFMMQSGFAMVCAGAVRKKNVQNTVSGISIV